MNPSGIEPLDLKVLVRPDSAEKVSAGGIIIPDATADRQKFAVVKADLIAVGSNAFKEWGLGNAPASGSRILMAQYAGARVKGKDGEDYVLMNDEDCIALLAEEAGE
jgi:chaperonin GroES